MENGYFPIVKFLKRKINNFWSLCFFKSKGLRDKEKAMFDLKGKGINLDYLLGTVCMKRSC